MAGICCFTAHPFSSCILNIVKAWSPVNVVVSLRVTAPVGSLMMSSRIRLEYPDLRVASFQLTADGALYIRNTY